MDIPKPPAGGNLSCPNCGKNTLRQVNNELVCSECGYKRVISPK